MSFLIVPAADVFLVVEKYRSLILGRTRLRVVRWFEDHPWRFLTREDAEHWIDCEYGRDSETVREKAIHRAVASIERGANQPAAMPAGSHHDH